MMHRPTLERNNWIVAVRALSQRRGSLGRSATPVHDEPVVDLLPSTRPTADLGSGAACVAVAVSNVTEEIITAAMRSSGQKYDVVQFEYDEILGFSSNDDDLYQLYLDSVKQAFWHSQSSTVVGYGTENSGTSMSMWGTPLEVEGDRGQTGAVVVRRHGGLFLKSVTHLLSLVYSQHQTNLTGSPTRNTRDGTANPPERLSCSFMAVGAHEVTDLLAVPNGGRHHHHHRRSSPGPRTGRSSGKKTRKPKQHLPPPLRTVAKHDRTEIPHLTEHTIDDVQRAGRLLSQAFDALDDHTLVRTKQRALQEKKLKRALKTGPSSTFRRGSTVAREDVQHVDVVCRLHVDRPSLGGGGGGRTRERTTLTFVVMSDVSR
jgi:hypothetical protein